MDFLSLSLSLSLYFMYICDEQSICITVCIPMDLCGGRKRKGEDKEEAGTRQVKGRKREEQTQDDLFLPSPPLGNLTKSPNSSCSRCGGLSVTSSNSATAR